MRVAFEWGASPFEGLHGFQLNLDRRMNYGMLDMDQVNFRNEVLDQVFKIKKAFQFGLIETGSENYFLKIDAF